MPSLDVSIVIVGQLHSAHDINRPVKQPMTKDDWIQVHQDQVIKQENCHQQELNSIISFIHRITQFKLISIACKMHRNSSSVANRMPQEPFRKCIVQNFRRARMKVGS